MSTTKGDPHNPSVAPFGSWTSSLTSELIHSTTIGFGTIVVDGLTIYWIETRPTENGRHVIVKRLADGSIEDALSREFYARTKVHEYGGAAFTVCNGTIYFTEFSDQQLYQIPPDSFPQQITNRPGFRFADPSLDSSRNRIVAICEDHTKGARAAESKIVSVSLNDPHDLAVLLEGNDFYCSPKLSPDGKFLTWVTWNFPDMPWDNTELWLGEIGDENTITNKRRLAGGQEESVLMPKWSPSGSLYFISDRSGFWNLYRWNGKEVESLLPMSAEFARAQWHLGYSQYDFLCDGQIISSYNVQGNWHLATCGTDGSNFREIASPYTDIWWLNAVGDRAVFRGGASAIPQAIVLLKVDDGSFECVRTSTSAPFSDYSTPQVIEFQAGDHAAFGFYYPPFSSQFIGPENESPPLLVICHGGPTGMASTLFDLEKQFWTSRGFALLDVNYSGSAGYGRDYRNRLRKMWGLIDVEDCIAGALSLAERNLADRNRLFIKGGSAGGFTTLCALTQSDVFRAGASYYGICDLSLMWKETHKFESHYLDRLVGEYPKEEKLYQERSPINHADRLQKPVIFFQGLEDKIVPPNQSEIMAKALKSRKIPVAYIAFAREQHAFRRADTLKTCLDAEYAFYTRIAGIAPGAPLAPLKIENLD